MENCFISLQPTETSLISFLSSSSSSWKFRLPSKANQIYFILCSNKIFLFMIYYTCMYATLPYYCLLFICIRIKTLGRLIHSLSPSHRAKNATLCFVSSFDDLPKRQSASIKRVGDSPSRGRLNFIETSRSLRASKATIIFIIIALLYEPCRVYVYAHVKPVIRGTCRNGHVGHREVVR